MAAAKEAFAQAIDLIVQIGWLAGRRQIAGIWAVQRELKGGDVALEDVYLAPGYRMANDVDRLSAIQGILKGANTNSAQVEQQAKAYLSAEAETEGKLRL